MHVNKNLKKIDYTIYERNRKKGKRKDNDLVINMEHNTVLN